MMRKAARSAAYPATIGKATTAFGGSAALGGGCTHFTSPAY